MGSPSAYRRLFPLEEGSRQSVDFPALRANWDVVLLVGQIPMMISGYSLCIEQ